MDDDTTSTAREALPSEQTHVFPVPAEALPARLDRFLADVLRGQGLSREKVKALIREGGVFLGDRELLSPKHALACGDVLRVRVPEVAAGIAPEKGELAVLYQDAWLAVLDKPAGLTVHPAPGLTSGTLAHRLVAHFPAIAAQEGLRPGIVHRLDKDTSGLMLVALTERCRLALAEMFARHEVYKEYLALVHGVPDTREGSIDAPIGRHPTQKVKMAVIARAKAARSAWRVLYADPKRRFSLVAVRIFSGRTHQVRVHMQHIGHPLWGDALYGGAQAGAAGQIKLSKLSKRAERAAEPPTRQMLHAWKLAFPHPLAAAGHTPATLRFTCPPPNDFAEAVRFLGAHALRVVITGSPGCGKSALLAIWKGMGVPVFSADAEVRRLYEKGGYGQRLLRERFGERFVPFASAPVDKIALGAAMREDASLRREVEALLHPLVRHALTAFWREHDVPLTAAEIPLYLEAGFAADDGAGAHEGADDRPVLVGVFCPFALRQERLLEKRGWSEAVIARMESWQWPEDKKMAACEILLDNTGTEQELQERAARLLDDLRALHSRREERLLARFEALWREEDRTDSSVLPPGKKGEATNTEPVSPSPDGK